MSDNSIYYMINPEDDLESISKKTGIPLNALWNMKSNTFMNVDNLNLGDQIVWKDGVATYENHLYGPLSQKPQPLPVFNGIEDNLQNGNIDLDEEANIQNQKREELQNDFLNDDDIGVDSQSAKDVCEVCDNKKLKCLCHVEIISPLREKKYEWKAGSIGELADEVTIIGIHSSDSFNSFKMSFVIKGSKCNGIQGPFPDLCTNLYYYEKNINDQLMGNIENKGHGNDLLLKFHDDYLNKEKKAIPYYLMTKEDQNKKVTFEPKKDGKPLYLKEFSFTLKDSQRENIKPAPIKLDLNNEQTNNLITFLQRAFSFSILSQLDYMPASAFHLGVLECKDGDMNNVKDNNILSYHPFDQAKAEIYVMPHYKLAHQFSLEFGSVNMKKGFTAQDFLKALKEINLSIEFDEKFNGKQGGKAKFEIENVVEFLKKVCIKNYAVISILLEVLDSAPNFIAKSFPEGVDYKVSNKSLFDEIVSFVGVSLPKVTLSGTSKIKVENESFTIEREDVRLATDPLLGGKIKFNLASLLLQKIPVATIIYGGLKQAEMVNNWTDNVRIDISTDKDYMSNLSQLELAERANSSVEVRLILYAHFIIKPQLKPAINILSSDLGVTEYKLDGTEALSVGLEFAAGISFKGRVYRFYGGLDASIEVSTAFSYGFKDFPRKTADGKEYREYIDFGYFNGLTAMWKIEFYGGAQIGNVKVEGRDKWESEEVSKNENQFFDLDATKVRLNELQRSHDLYEKYIREERSKLFAERQKEPLIGGRMVFQQDRDRIRRNADSKFPENAEYVLLAKKINFYNENKHILDEVQNINDQLACMASYDGAEALLKRRFDLMKQINGGLHDHGIKLREGDFQLGTKEMEFEARDHYIQSIDNQIEQIKNERNYRLIESTPEARKEDARLRAAENQYKQSRLNQLEQEKKSIEEMDDVGRSILFDGCLLGARGLTTGERDALLQEMRGKK